MVASNLQGITDAKKKEIPIRPNLRSEHVIWLNGRLKKVLYVSDDGNRATICDIEDNHTDRGIFVSPALTPCALQIGDKIDLPPYGVGKVVRFGFSEENKEKYSITFLFKERAEELSFSLHTILEDPAWDYL